MNAPLSRSDQHMHQLTEAIAQACDRIAPTWPLDQFIAVNPYWGWVQQPITTAAARLGTLVGTSLTMPRSWFQARWREGHLQPAQLEAVARRHGGTPSAAELIAALDIEVAAHEPAGPLPLVTDLCDTAAPVPATRWPDVVTHQISQHCAAYFDDSQARWHLVRSAGLFGTWKQQLNADRGLSWPGGRCALAAHLALLPDDPVAAIGQALDLLRVPASAHADYLTALLLSINGWAAWCAFERWQARLKGGEGHHIVALLAIRACWEALLHRCTLAATPDWAARWADAQASVAQRVQAQQIDWLLQEALELAYQRPLAQALAQAVQPPPAALVTPSQPSAPLTSPVPPLPTAPSVQAVFCIDVRSEVFRRALEATDRGIHTRGFAGFFGLPIAYTPLGSALTRPQLPGLLSPTVTVSESTGSETSLAEVITQRRKAALDWRQRWADLRSSAASGFSFVETCGLVYGAELVRQSLPSTAATERWEDIGVPAARQGATPRLPQASDDPAAAAAMAHAILGAMGLPDRQDGFAPLVLLAGHGSQSANNPHTAGLDCGACGGQTGEVNARVLADVLNTAAVREALKDLGLTIPATTHFLPALHNTTTDDVQLFDLDQVPIARAPDVARLRQALADAGQRARAERAASLGLAASAGDARILRQAVHEHANDWAQVRPEWGLANCASFIVAPRTRTRGLNLAGRSFLHDYDFRQDTSGAVLELIMTAPMVVTNWINLQYHASTVDNRLYGSGDKVLHNVVGGHLGVFEGNGGDLRIGLPLQSLHDGHTLRHTPLRLSVFIEAPRVLIDAVIHKHAVVRDLVDNGWLHLLRIDPVDPMVEQRRDGEWQVLAHASWPGADAFESSAKATPG